MQHDQPEIGRIGLELLHRRDRDIIVVGKLQRRADGGHIGMRGFIHHRDFVFRLDHADEELRMVVLVGDFAVQFVKVHFEPLQTGLFGIHQERNGFKILVS